MKDKAGSPQDYNEHDICDLFEDMMFSMPERMSRGPGGRGCGRGRGPGRGGPGMGSGGRGCGREPHGRPDPRQMPFEYCNQGSGVFGGPHGRPDPRQMPFGHCNQGSRVFGGPYGRPDPRQMPFGYCNQGSGVFGGPHGRPGPRQMPFGHLNQGSGVFGGPHGRPDPRQMPFIHGSHLYGGFDATQAHEDTNGNSSSSDTDNAQDATNKETHCDSERRNFPKNECRRAWRRFMRRQLSKCPRRPVYGYGPPQAWRPPCAHPMAGGPPPCGPMVPPHMLRRLHRLLTALESEMDKEANTGKDEGKQTANQEANHEEPTPRHARLQARLRRLIVHTKQQLDENAHALPPHPWMMRMQAGPAWGALDHMRRMRKHKIRTQACETDATNEDKPDKETEEVEDAPQDEDIAIATSGRDALNDWQDLRQDVEDIQDEQEDVAPEVPSELCQTCGCSIPL